MASPKDFPERDIDAEIYSDDDREVLSLREENDRIKAINVELLRSLKDIQKHQEVIAPKIFKGTGAWAIAYLAIARYEKGL